MRSPYATLSDVNGLLSFVPTFGATTKPNGSQVTGFLAMAADDLDAALVTHNYAVPIASSAVNSFELVRDWSSVGAAYYTAAAMPQGIDSKHLAIYERRWDAILEGLRNGSLQLPTDAPVDPTLSGTRFAGTPNAVGATPYFSRETIITKQD